MKKLSIIIALGACTPIPPATPPAAEDTCNALSYAQVIGQDATALERILLLGKVRITRPGQAVTMDYQADRINFRIDDANRVSAITCG